MSNLSKSLVLFLFGMEIICVAYYKLLCKFVINMSVCKNVKKWSGEDEKASWKKTGWRINWTMSISKYYLKEVPHSGYWNARSWPDEKGGCWKKTAWEDESPGKNRCFWKSDCCWRGNGDARWIILIILNSISFVINIIASFLLLLEKSHDHHCHHFYHYHQVGSKQWVLGVKARKDQNKKRA